jgi:DNA mismatch repair protein MutS
MVEMVETAAILNQATEKSLVILDEIGRGTATYDGLSIAWACVEYLHDTLKCRCLFATHYHELNSLTAALPRLASYSMAVKEWDNSIVFLHNVQKGAADRSYGVHVARLAGLPTAVTARAQEVLTALETEPVSAHSHNIRPVSTPALPAISPAEKDVLQRLHALTPDNLSPKEALEALYFLKKGLS